jgi:hypothetical protein
VTTFVSWSTDVEICDPTCRYISDGGSSGPTPVFTYGNDAPLGQGPPPPTAKPDPPPESQSAGTAGEGGAGKSALDKVQVALDIFGLVPGVGEVADFANGVISLARGDYGGRKRCQEPFIEKTC